MIKSIHSPNFVSPVTGEICFTEKFSYKEDDFRDALSKLEKECETFYLLEVDTLNKKIVGFQEVKNKNVRKSFWQKILDFFN